MNLVNLLKTYHPGSRIYSSVHGWLTLIDVDPKMKFPIITKDYDGHTILFRKNGSFTDKDECILKFNKDTSFVELF